MQSQTEYKAKPFAKIKEDKFVIETDTVVFKNEIKELLFSDTDVEVILDKIKVDRNFIVGEKKSEYYFVIIYDTKHHLKVVKWLNRVNDSLYFTEKVGGRDLFEQTYQICIGKSNCEPNVFILEGKKIWGCGDSPVCLIEVTKDSCKSYKTVAIE